MFTQPVASPPPSMGPGSSASTSNPSSTSRTSRLRGLSYLRNYTHNHILSREHSAANSQPASLSSTPPSQQPAIQARRNTLTRSVSYSSAPSTPSAIDATSNPLSLVASHQEPITAPRTKPPTPPPATIPEQAAAESSSDAQASPSANGNEVDMEEPMPEPRTTRLRSSTTGDVAAMAAAVANVAASTSTHDALPSIRFSAYFDPRATRPSLSFSPVARTLPSGGETIRVGRYSERENQPAVPHNVPSAAPVGFKSKVVSRRHCEFWYDQGKWYIKDVKSSSGTFLNHIRLSPPGTESKPFPINDGDIVQLGIDFKGGEEMIFRCVKMRLELNRGWQNKPNAFNVQNHKRLRNLTSSANSTNSTQDCSICLNSIAPCQSLFVAPCSHTWHYKCIRALLNTPQYPTFVCPNCRMAADLEADIEDPDEDWDVEAEESEKKEDDGSGADAKMPASDPSQDVQEARPAGRASSDGDEPVDVTGRQEERATRNTAADRSTLIPSSVSQPMTIRSPSGPLHLTNGLSRDRTPSPPGQPHLNGHEGPITPRNDAGPWVFDGSAAGSRNASMSEEAGGMRSLDAATEMDVDR
ncbi:RING finger protein [Verticillium dahliae VdLs.17]|uniref:RING-type E3 ubiquitin transferase n=2 Tax=Verticillium dahliae TaxID=27337 RepID=G2XJR5_VERDV|nr:RING finger protein [Verticillium dahliae VdLs.17]EGY20768.1 RING finger protein [Verticillium dahliae VdLs.17]KAH6708075.1 RING finger protein [Verticillium dahliae]PNH52735.1 hypothetical protein VD0003_g4623 [Verticillium dahliae]